MNSFMKHLAGLRGFAILLIVLFHLNEDVFSEGYLGVDVFLVISGYLLIAGWLNKGYVPFWNFVSKKVIRIIPPLAVLVLPVLASAAYIVNSEEAIYSAGETALMALLGVSNIYLEDTTTDYFAAAANLNPFLHTWYLSVTLQVYVLWIVCCLVFRHLSRKWMISFLVAAGVVSLIYTHSYQLQDAAAWLGLPTWGQLNDISYFRTGGRIWEFLAGGLVFVLPAAVSVRARWTGCAFGGVLLLGALLFGADMGGRLAVLSTVIATVLLLKYVPGTLVDALLGNRLIQGVSKVSFSWYLVHFPLFVLFKIAWGGTLGAGLSCAVFVLSLMLACVMWWGVEKRRFPMWGALGIWGVSGAVAYTVGCTPAVVRVAFGDEEPQYPVYRCEIQKVSEHLFKGFNREQLVPSRGILACMGDTHTASPDLMPIGDASKPATFVVIGDSNAQHLWSGLNELAYSIGCSGVQLPSIIIPLWDRYIQVNGDNYLYDREKAEALLHWLGSHPELKTVFIGQLWDSRLRWTRTDWDKKNFKPSYEANEAALREFCKRVQSLGKKLVLIAPTPRMSYDPKKFESGLAYMRWRCKQSRSHVDAPEFILTEEQYKENNKMVFEIFSRLEKEGLCRVLHIEKGMFPDGEFRVCRGKVLYVRDPTHVTPIAAIAFLKEVKKEFIELLQAEK